MSHRIRGQEVTLRISVDGRLVEGSMFKVMNFTASPRSELPEVDFLGESETDIDFRHDGYDLSWSIQVLDEKAIDLLQDIVTREQGAQRHPRVTVTVLYSFREAGASGRVVVYHDCVLRCGDEGFGGRKEYVTVDFEAKAKRRSVLRA